MKKNLLIAVFFSGFICPTVGLSEDIPLDQKTHVSECDIIKTEDECGKSATSHFLDGQIACAWEGGKCQKSVLDLFGGDDDL